MAENVLVSCKRKPGDPYDPHNRIQGLGGMHNGKRWYLTEDAIIAEILTPEATRRWNFYTSDGRNSAWVVVAYRNQRPYLKTEPDSDREDNLLSLDECPR